MKFIRRNKNLLFVIIIFLVGLISLIQFKKILFPSGIAIYGNRLEGIEEVKITAKHEKAIKEKMKDVSKETNVRVSGRIINIIIKINDDVSRNSAKKFAERIFDVFSQKELKFYDIQVFIEKDIESKEFPIIGYKHQNEDKFLWTKDRA